jgi:hypothetical protein
MGAGNVDPPARPKDQKKPILPPLGPLPKVHKRQETRAPQILTQASLATI